MLIELALIILIIIMAVTELFKYTNIFGLMHYGDLYEIQQDCQCSKESFNENDLYRRDLDARTQLRYWGKLCPNTEKPCS